MRATLNLPPSVLLIEAALEGLVQVNRVLIETGAVPPSPLDSGVKYKRERSGLEEWDNAHQCLKRGWGDCEDLNAWECARINIEEDPEAICTLIQTGKRMFHCVVLLSDGSYRDVCPELGMRVPGTSLEGIPWLETRGENIIGSTAAQNQRRLWRQRRPKPTGPKSSNPYRPKPSPAKPAYQPKSSRTDRRPTPETPTRDRDEGSEAMSLVSPTSATQPQAMTATPMENYSDEVYDDAAQLDLDPMLNPEAFDEELEETDEDEDEELTS